MFAWIIGSSLRYRFLVIAAAVALVGFGFDELKRMPVDVFPEFAPPKVEVQTEGMGMTSTEVEELVTTPLDTITGFFDPVLSTKTLRSEVFIRLEDDATWVSTTATCP